MSGSSGFEYFPMEEGTNIVYREFAITGSWQPNMELWVLTKQYTGRDVCITSRRHSAPGFIGYFQNWRNVIYPELPVNYNKGLVNTPFIYGNNTLGMGEVRNEMGWVMYPPECILTYDPVPGELVQATTRVYENGFNGPYLASGAWTYKTIGHYPMWGVFPDTWRTALKEDTGRRYNYVFMRGVGMVDFWHIDPITGQGFEYYAIDWTGKEIQ